MKGRFASVLALGLLVGCASDDQDSAVDVGYADVEPILNEHCLGCHVVDGEGPFAFDGYEAASSRSERIVARAVDAEGGSMPPAGVTVTDAQAEILRAWDAAGAPQ